MEQRLIDFPTDPHFIKFNKNDIDYTCLNVIRLLAKNREIA